MNRQLLTIYTIGTVCDCDCFVLQVFFVVLQFYSPQPRAVIVERKKSADSSWEAWQYYADDCMLRFGLPNKAPLRAPSDVNCLQYDMRNLR